MIEGWCGRVGSGKTYCLVKRCLPFIGRMPIYANDPAFRFAIPFERWEDLWGVGNAIVILDELAAWAAARQWAKLPPEVADWVRQSRKDGLQILFTAQSFGSVDNTFKAVTASVHMMQRYGPFIREVEVEPQGNQVMLKRWHYVDKRVYRWYDTYSIVADAEGRGARLGAKAVGIIGADLARLLARGVVRVEVAGEVAYRRATVWDVEHCARVVVDGEQADLRLYQRAMDTGQWAEVQAVAAGVTERSEGGTAATADEGPRYPAVRFAVRSKAPLPKRRSRVDEVVAQVQRETTARRQYLDTHVAPEWSPDGGSKGAPDGLEAVDRGQVNGHHRLSAAELLLS